MAGFCLLAACSKESVDRVTNEQTLVPVTVHVSDFNVTQEDFSGGTTRAAQNVVDYSGIKAITLAFYAADDMQQYKTTQLKEDASTYTTFGEFSLQLPKGSYTMVVIANGFETGDELAVNSPTEALYTGAHVRETFVATQAVNITSTSSVELSATLNRIVSKLQVISTDGRAANVTNIRMTFSAGGKDFNPSTGFAISDFGFANTVGGTGTTGNISVATSYVFLATDEQNINVTIETLDADQNVINSTTVNNVPFKRNRVTKLVGAMYPTAGTAASFTVNTDWLEDHDVDF